MTQLPMTEAMLDAMAETLRQTLAGTPPVIIGIHTGGVWVAEALHRRLGATEPAGVIDISFYRDDFSRAGLHPQVRPSRLPVAVNDRTVLLVDDVLHTGRTVRAALNTLFDYGRPDRVLLAVLAQRPGRELPVAPDAVGHSFPALPAGAHVRLCGPDPLELTVEMDE